MKKPHALQVHHLSPKDVERKEKITKDIKQKTWSMYSNKKEAFNWGSFAVVHGY